MEETKTGHTNYFYHPKKGDTVIGTIRQRTGDDWLVNIGYSHGAILPELAFNGATKRNCPKFERGDLVLCTVHETPDTSDVLLTCVTKTKTDKMGPLNGGTLVRGRPDTLTKFLEFDMADLIRTKTAFTFSFGKNGLIWIDASNPTVSAQLAHAITESLGSDNPRDTLESFLERINFVSHQ